jgi:3-hydroxyisobutyrate dehydrogenase
VCADRFSETDLGLALAAANQNDLKLPSGTLTTAVYEKLKADPEFGEKDFSVVFKWLEKANQKAE